MNIENYLSSIKFKTRKQLTEETKMSDRAIRNEISNLKKQRVVIYNSSIKGYRLAREIKSMSKIELEEEVRLINRSIADIQSRKKVFNMQLKKYIAYLKKVENLTGVKCDQGEKND